MIRRFATKIYRDSKHALNDVKDGASFLMGGFGMVGNAENSLRCLNEMGVKNLVIYTNSVGLSNQGQGPLITSGQVAKVYVTFLGFYHALEKLYCEGKAEMIPIAQGTMVESFRCAKGGLGGFYTKTAAGTWLQTGEFPIKYREDGTIEKYNERKELRKFDNVDYVFEEPLTADYGLLKGYVADKYGNIRFRKTSRNYNPDLAGAARITVAEVEHIIDKLPPDQIHLPGIFVDRVYKGEWFGKKVERLQLREIEQDGTNQGTVNPLLLKIAKRLSKEFKPGMYINLGVGVPGDTTKFLPKDFDVNLQMENGIIGGGEIPTINEIDSEMTDASRLATTTKIGHCFMSSAESFGIMRGHHLHMTVLGSFEVSQYGDFANYLIPRKMYRGVGGAMDLVAGCDYVMIGMRHIYNGKPRVLKKCTLPLTASKCVDKLVTEYAVFEFSKTDPKVMTLIELVDGMSLEEFKKITPADYVVSKNLKKYQE